MSKKNSDAESRRAHLYTLKGMCVLWSLHLSEGEFRKCLRMIHPKKGSPSGRNAYPVTEKMEELKEEEKNDMAKKKTFQEYTKEALLEIEKTEAALKQAKLEKEQDIRVVYQQKDSLAKKENPVAFSLGEEGLKWLGEYDISIEDLLMGKAGTKKETKLEKEQKLILELLTKRKVMCLEELEAELLAYGISSKTGRDARKQLENRLSYDWCQGRKTVALITE